MTKLRALNIKGFRGARFELPIDFKMANNSISIYGENATGKSTITDAVEWFLLGKVEHLWREDCKEEALRNVLLSSSDVCQVAIQFSDAALNGSKSLGADLKTKTQNLSAELKVFLEAVRAERIFLRHAQITKFIGETKSKKREEIAAIIGYQDILAFRDVIQGCANALRKDSGYITAKQYAEDAKNRIFSLTKSIVSTEEDLFKKTTGLTAQFDLGITITSDATYDEALEKMHAKISKPDNAAVGVRLEQLKNECANIADLFSALLKAKESFFASYNVLVKDKDIVSQLNIEQFLVQGHQVIKAGHFSEENCPFCLTPYGLDKLQFEVGQRVEKIRHIRKQYDESEGLKSAFVAAVSAVGVAAKRFETEYHGMEKFSALLVATPTALELLRSWIKATNVCFSKFEAVTIADEELQKANEFLTIVKQQIEVATKEIATLQLTEKEKILIQTIEQARDLRVQYRQYDKYSNLAKAYEQQILSLSEIFDEFIVVQNNALQVVLDKISKDVGAYYSYLHPSENVDQVRLVIVGEEGIEFQYRFHGTPTHPPMKYLSESHLNSLGICLFLASAKLFNKASRFLVLDDIVTSFDLGHRRRLLRLIKEKFGDWQVILLTHEHLWFEMIKREFKQSPWLFSETSWDSENGVQMASSAVDWKDLIAEKRKKYDVSNDIRKMLEATLKEICHSLEVKVQFRFNDENEHRMSGELLSALRSTINRKCPSLKGHEIFSQLEASNLLITVGSHDNPAEKIMGGDIDVALGDIDKLVGLFLCIDCDRYIGAGLHVAGQNKITCKCGKKGMDWKK